MSFSRTGGVVILDADGELIFRSGLGRSQGIQTALFDLIKKRENEERFLSPMKVDGDNYFVMGWITDEHSAFLIDPEELNQELFEFISSVDFGYDLLNEFFNHPYSGMTVVDRNGKIVYLGSIHEKFFDLGRGDAVGKHVTEVIENTRLHQVVETGVAEIGQLQEMNGITRVVSRFPVIKNGEAVGAFGRVMFKGPEKLAEMNQQIAKLKSELQYYRREARNLRDHSHGLNDLVGRSEAIRQLKSDLSKVAGLDVPVLLLGESGTGKELAAQAIHSLSERREKSMVTVNSGAIPGELVESELFGYESGSFTGAHSKGRRGKFEAAHNSSIFLDEIGEMPTDVQVKLLRVLQDGNFTRLGGESNKHSDFRLISATNRDLSKMVEEDQFRLDLYYRLSTVTIELPALSERLEDIPDLVQSFINNSNSPTVRKIKHIDPRVYHYLREKAWPGNIRQLMHEVEKATIFCESSELGVEDFRPQGMKIWTPTIPEQEDETGSMKSLLQSYELSLIRKAMARHNGNKKRVAEELGISRSYLYKKLNEDESDLCVVGDFG
ncbi:hypothetical protein A8B84_04960 [Marinobacter sp. EhC06]|jgi:transcriptional regulator with PAS, ATPase and Fis domain|uniref:sigma-54 interaction domain-containing protein n=1 Tax=Marinobacter TaxID=2742 RepID=UPI0007D9F656|nr:MULTISPECIES: sigma 54-interacting transcriptional regulator [unclassified Marinobacter]OAN87991.1 hypothetical protein A8B80_03170 [Marinobacter sp. EhN04]OAN90975.1 hypothetical protein A8B84_04960 [Marinobacter sp. EhC06]